MFGVGKDELDKNPEFSKFLIFLKTRLNENGISIEKDNEANALEKELNIKRTEYFKKKVLYDQITSFVMEDEIEFSKDETDLKNVVLDLKLADSYAKEGLSFENSSPSIDHQKQEKQNFMKKFIEDKVEKSINDIVDELLDTYKELSDDSDTVVTADTLPHLIEADVKEVQELQQVLKHKQLGNKEAMKNAHQALTSAAQLGTEIMEKHLLGHLPHDLDIDVNYTSRQLEALILKVQSTKLNLYDETYHRDALKVLHSIKKEINKKIEECKGETEWSMSVLKSYEGLGEEFSVLVDKYAKLKDEIGNKKWALNEMK